MLRSIVVGVGVLLTSSPVWAINHWQLCKDAFEAGTAITTSPLPLDPDAEEAYCFDTGGADGTASSNLLDGRKCEYADVKVHSPDGGSAANIDVSFYVCDAPEGTNCTPITGIDNTATTWPNSFSFQYGYVDVVDNTGSDDVRTEVRCFHTGDKK